MTKTTRPDFPHDEAAAPPVADDLVPVIWSPSITVNRVPRYVVELPNGAFALYCGEPGELSQLSYAVTWDKGIARARDILAGRWPEDRQKALLTLAALIVAVNRPCGDPVNQVAITARAAQSDDEALL